MVQAPRLATKKFSEKLFVQSALSVNRKGRHAQTILSWDHPYTRTTIITTTHRDTHPFRQRPVGVNHQEKKKEAAGGSRQDRTGGRLLGQSGRRNLQATKEFRGLHNYQNRDVCNWERSSSSLEIKYGVSPLLSEISQKTKGTKEKLTLWVNKK